MTTEGLRILIADDHPLVRKGLIDILRDGHSTVVIGEAARGDTAIQMALANDWDVLVLDITMPGANGLEVLKVVKRTKPTLPVVMLSMHVNAAYVGVALKLGAVGYVSKEAVTDELVTAIHAVLAGETYLCRRAAQQLRRASRHDGSISLAGHP